MKEPNAPTAPASPGDHLREAAVAHARSLGAAAVEHAGEVMEAVRERLAPAAPAPTATAAPAPTVTAAPEAPVETLAPPETRTETATG